MTTHETQTYSRSALTQSVLLRSRCQLGIPCRVAKTLLYIWVALLNVISPSISAPVAHPLTSLLAISDGRCTKKGVLASGWSGVIPLLKSLTLNPGVDRASPVIDHV